MPRHMLPQVGTPVWYFNDPTRRPQAAIVTKRTNRTTFNLALFNGQTGATSGVIGASFYEAGQKPASGPYCTPTRIQDDYDGATDTTTLSQKAVAVATFPAGGTGYVVGDVLSVTGSGGVTIRVTTAAGGVVSAATIVNAGNVVKPGPAGTLSTTGGSGTGCTVTLTWADN